MSSSEPVGTDVPEKYPMLFGQPTGLYTLFFAEMWERFSFYGMRALLTLYMVKGFLKYNDAQAYTVYGAYTALVYMTPFIGGVLADKLLGQRRAVVMGGVLMSLGHLLMASEGSVQFFFALALIIVGNGFFKPNVSSAVGELYYPNSPRRDSGFTIFYMGINLGAAISPLLCGYLGETYGWHWGFGLAAIGMMVGLAVFVMPTLVTQLLIAAAAVATAVGLVIYSPDNAFSVGINIFAGVALLVAAVVACISLNVAGLPAEVGQPPKGAFTPRRQLMLYGGVLLAIPIAAMFVSGFSPIMPEGKPLQLISDATVKGIAESGAMGKIASVALAEMAKPAGLMLTIIGVISFGYLIIETVKQSKVWRERLILAQVLIFFQMLFFAFFEQAGSSINNFTDRNVSRVSPDRVVTAEDVGEVIVLQPTQAQLGYSDGSVMFTMSTLTELREKNNGNPDFTIDWQVAEDNVGMGIAARNDELPASTFQALNAVFILLFGLPFAVLWTYLRKHRIDLSPLVKFALGLIQCGLGFGALWYGTTVADHGMSPVIWLVLGYLLHTTGELCLSPVGLSQMTKLSPKQLVSTVMGAWFLATAFSQYLAAIISQFTGVTSESGDESLIPPPMESINVYGDVFWSIAIAAIVSGVICWLLAPVMSHWQHEGYTEEATA